MNIRDLRYIVAVADTLSFRRASEQCYISQPTLSMQIKKVEQRLAVDLFERNNKQVLVTHAGKRIIDAARMALINITQMETIAKNAANPFAGKCNLGIFPTLAPYLLPQFVPKLTRQYKQLSLFLIEEKTQTLIEQLQKAQIDCALLAIPLADDEQFRIISLFEDEFVLAVHPSHALANRKSITYSDIHHEALLLLEEGHCLREQALSVCQLSGAIEHNEFRATSLETLRQMVIANNGVTLIPKIAIGKKDKNIYYIPFKHKPPTRQIALIYRKSDTRDELMLAIANIIREHMQNKSH